MRYNKLVRDRVPEIILEKEGVMPKIRIADDDDEYYAKLREKLQEEVGEFMKDPSVGELVDVMEVLDALFSCGHYDRDEVQEAKEKKAWERGGFSKRIILLEA